MHAVVTTIPFILMIVAAAYIWYVTIQGARTGILRGRGRIDRSTKPGLFWVTLFAYAALSVVCSGAVGLLIYGETHPEWRRSQHAPSAR